MSKYVIRKRKIKSTIKQRWKGKSWACVWNCLSLVFDVNHLVASSRLLGQHTKRRVLQTSYATASCKSALISASQPDTQAPAANTARPRDMCWCITRYARIFTKIYLGAYLPDVIIICSQFHINQWQGFDSVRGRISPFPIGKHDRR